MQVDLPQLLVVLSHELRGPASVLQGYLRLLQQTPPTAPIDPVVLDGMRTAATRVADVGHHASALEQWLRASDAPRAPVTMTALSTLIAALLPPPHAMAPLPDGLTAVSIRTRDAARLADAVATLARAAARDWLPTPAAVSVDWSPASAATVAFAITPAPTTPARSEPPGPNRFAFTGGGMGLSLVLASFVLDAHGAQVDLHDRGLSVRLPCLAEGES